MYKLSLVLLSPRTFSFCFYPWPYILSLQTCSRKSSIFSIAVHGFRNLFWKICPLFGKILITCLKCSRTSFSRSCYSKKMHWGQGWEWEIASFRSLIYKKNSKGPNTDPCGTPWVTSILSETVSLIIVCWILFVRYDSNQLSVSPITP